MATERPELNRLEVLRALRISNLEAIFATVHGTLTGGAIQTDYALWLGANQFWMGVLGAIPTLSALVQLVSSYFVERRGERKWFTAWFSGIGRLLWLPILLIPFALPPEARFTAFLLLFLAFNVLLNVPVPAFTSWMSDLVPPGHRGRYFGHRNMLAGITTVVVSLPAAWFLDLALKRHLFSEAVGFAALFGLAAVCGTLSFACLMRQAEPPMQRKETEVVHSLSDLVDFYRPSFREPNFRRFLQFSAVLAVGQFFAGPFFTVYALQELKLDLFWVQFLNTIASLAGLLSLPLWGYLCDKFGNKPLLSIAVFGVSVVPLGWVFTSRAHWGITFLLLGAIHVASGVFWNGVGLTQFNLLIGISPDDRKSVYVGALSAVIGITGGAAPIVGGILLTTLHSVQIAPLGWAMGGFQILFALNAAQRFMALAALRGLSDTGSSRARDVLAQLGTARVGGFMHIRRLQRAQSETERRHAAQALRSSRTALAVEELIIALDDPSLSVREEAARALGEIGDARAVDALLTRVDDRDSGIADEAAEALGRIGDVRAIGPLARMLATAEKPYRLAAARALGRIGHDDAVTPLLQVVEQEGSKGSEVVEACVGALGAIRSPEAVIPLIRLLPGSARALRIALVRALGEIGDHRAADSLLALLPDEHDAAIIAYIAAALALMEATGAVRPLLDALERVELPVARKQIVNAIGALMGEEEAFYPFLALDSFARDEAVSRMLREMARGEHSDERTTFGPRRRTRQWDRVLEQYLAGSFGSAVLLLERLTTGPKDRSTSSIKSEVWTWVIETSRRRPLQADEFLLALFALRLPSD